MVKCTHRVGKRQPPSLTHHPLKVKSIPRHSRPCRSTSSFVLGPHRSPVPISVPLPPLPSLRPSSLFLASLQRNFFPKSLHFRHFFGPLFAPFFNGYL